MESLVTKYETVELRIRSPATRRRMSRTEMRVETSVSGSGSWTSSCFSWEDTVSMGSVACDAGLRLGRKSGVAIRGVDPGEVCII